MNNKRVLICIPVHHCPQLETIKCLLETIKYSKCKIFYHINPGNDIVRLRNEMGRVFLKMKDYDYLMWIDDDITWENGIIDLLVSREKDIIGGVCSVKSNSGKPVIRPFYIQKLLDTKKYKNQKIKVPKNKLFEVEYVGTGFMLISRQCIENVYATHPFPFQPISPKREYLSEDWAFCHRAKSLGYKVWAETTFELGHIGYKRCVLK